MYISLLYNHNLDSRCRYFDLLIIHISDVKKMPLGKLSKSQVAKGFECLEEIEDKIENKTKKGGSLADLSSR